jgi:cytochrome c biogenesis protein CcdA
MNKAKLLLFAAVLLLIPLVTAQEKTCFYFFYGDGCLHCAKAEPFVNQIEQSLPVEAHRFEVYNDRENLVLLNKYFDSYGVPDKERGVPAVFLSNAYLVGYSPIANNLSSIMAENGGAECPVLDGRAMSGISNGKAPVEKLSQLTLLTIISAALVDSINPCAIAVLLILLAALLAAGQKERVLRAGFAFTLSIYIAYLLFGLGLFSALQISGISYWFYKIVGALAIIIGLANIKDYFWYGAGGFVMEIPRSWRPALKKILGGVTSTWGAFLAGFIVCLFELPCTGGPYIVILGLLAERMTMLASLPLLLLYNVFFVLPLILLTLLVYSGYSNVEKATEWKEHNIRRLHLFAGIVMLALGLLIVLGFV